MDSFVFIDLKNNFMEKIKTILLLSVFFTLISCSDKDESYRSSEKEILSFTVYDNYSASIDESRKEINLVLPYDTHINSLTPSIKISPKAIISPASDIAQDFSNPVTYIVQAEDGSKHQYTVNVALEKSILNRIRSFSINGVKGKIKDEWTVTNLTQSNSILIWLKGVTDVTNLEPIIEISGGATISPKSGEKIDFSKPVTYTVTAENGSTTHYTVGVESDIFPSGLLYATKIVNTNRTQNISINCNFSFDPFGKLKSYTKATNLFYIENNLADGSVTYIKYDNNGKISQLIFEDRENNTAVSTRTLNITYPHSKTIYITEQLDNANTKQDIVTLNDRNKVSKFETNNKTEYYTYDKYDNLINQTTEGQGYKKIEYDSYNGIFTYSEIPHWILLYTVGELIGTGTNNPISIEKYTLSNELIETTSYDYKYNPQTRYPRSYSCKIGNDEFRNTISLNYIFPFELNLSYGRD